VWGWPARRTAIVLEQGGSLTLSNRLDGGLQAKVTLPLG
jgi:hypothetical protein